LGEVKPFPTPGSGSTLKEPVSLQPHHDRAGFDCGAPGLNEWLRRRALKNQENRGSRTFVVCEGNTVVGYFCLAAGSVLHVSVTPRARRNMPDPIPVMVLGRLAVDKRWQGRGIGAAMLREAVLRTLAASEHAGLRAILVHAKDDEAKRFCLKFGFEESPTEEPTLMVTVDEIAEELSLL
jgi:GNAT superfamily N-acetyltransferase